MRSRGFQLCCSGRGDARDPTGTGEVGVEASLCCISCGVMGPCHYCLASREWVDGINLECDCMSWTVRALQLFIYYK